MAGNRTLKLSILADVDDLNKKLKQANGEVETSASGMEKFGKMATAAMVAAAAAAAAFAVKFAKDAIMAGEAAATANARIEQISTSMGLFGEATAAVSERLIKLAEATARQTGVDTNSIKLTQAKLLTFKELAVTADEVGGAFDRATMAAIDMASAGFGEASQNAVQLGKALNDPIKGINSLTRSGITFTEAEKERIKTLVESNRIGEAQNTILKAIETQVGGTALATANATDKLKVMYAQLTEQVGMKLLPVLDWMVDLFQNKMPIAIDFLKKVFQPLTDSIMRNKDTFIGLFNFIKDNIIPILTVSLGGALTFLTKFAPIIVDAVSAAIRALQPIINAAIDGINLLIKAMNYIKPGPDIPTLSKLSISSGSSSSSSTSVPKVTVPTISVPTTTTPSGTSSASGVSSASNATLTATQDLYGNTLTSFGARTSGAVTDPNVIAAYQNIFGAAKTTPVTVNIGVVGDPESAARTITDIVQNSIARGTGGQLLSALAI